jgi:tetratricopeptide (TPR) repeat protein
MLRPLLLLALLSIHSLSFSQFASPRPNDHDHSPDLYQEDPFITRYRHRFFAVFHGDVATFRKAYQEIAQMAANHPNDPRAVVWLGNGQTVEAALKLLRGDTTGSLQELVVSRRNLDRAVSLAPRDPHIYMMRAATLYVQGQYWPAKLLPATVWATLRDDCQSLIAYLGPKRITQVSLHVRGETYGELGIALKNLGETKAAIDAFTKVIQLCPDSNYDARAKREINSLQIRK